MALCNTEQNSKCKNIYSITIIQYYNEWKFDNFQLNQNCTILYSNEIPCTDMQLRNTLLELQEQYYKA